MNSVINCILISFEDSNHCLRYRWFNFHGVFWCESQILLKFLLHNIFLIFSSFDTFLELISIFFNYSLPYHMFIQYLFQLLCFSRHFLDICIHIFQNLRTKVRKYWRTISSIKNSFVKSLEASYFSNLQIFQKIFTKVI